MKWTLQDGALYVTLSEHEGRLTQRELPSGAVLDVDDRSGCVVGIEVVTASAGVPVDEIATHARLTIAELRKLDGIAATVAALGPAWPSAGGEC